MGSQVIQRAVRNKIVYLNKVNMNKREFIDAIEDMPDEATIFLDGDFINLIEADSVNYDPD